jgi:hypothetical protein
MKFTREQVIEMARVVGFSIECRNSIDGDEVVDGFGGVMTDELTRLCTLAADAALEAAAHAFEQHNRENRQWVNGSLWGNLTTEGCARIRAMKDKP